MSLRWKLLRFLRVDPLLSPPGPDASDADIALFPSLATGLGPVSPHEALLRRFCTAADRALHATAHDGLHAFALPRAVVQLFYLPTPITPQLPPVPPHISFSPHDSAVVAVQLVSAPISTETAVTTAVTVKQPTQTDGSAEIHTQTSQPLSNPSQSAASAAAAAVASTAVSAASVVGMVTAPAAAAAAAAATVVSSVTIGTRPQFSTAPWLATLGHDDGGATVKLWAFRSVGTSRSGAEEPTVMSSGVGAEWGSDAPVPDVRPDCVANFRLPGDARPTALAVAPGLEHLAVGFTDGSVTILSGELWRERTVRTRVAPAPAEMIEPRAVVYLQYARPDLLYAVSEVSVAVVAPAPPQNGRIAFRRDVLDNLGADSPRLCAVTSHSAELVVAKAEALYFFNREGRGPCLAFPTGGKRALIATVGNYIVHSTGTGSTTAYDVVNKLIAYRGKGIVTWAFPSPERGSKIDSIGILICFAEGSVVQLKEISLEDRVNMLLKRGLYVSAVSLARAESSRVGNSSMLTRALRQYAEYLMTKNRYDHAAEQLISTIGGDVEPSWVITRLVEQPGLRSGLRLYLEALHSSGRAVFAHTKVLITCYRHDRARGVILGSTATEKTTDEYVINVFSDVDWSEEQVDAAIVLCRDAGLHKVADRVARRRGRYVQLARTLVLDLGDLPTALQLLRSIPEAEALKVISAVGRQLLVKDSEGFVAYLAEAICRSTAEAPRVGPPGTPIRPVLRLDAFLPLFIDMPRWRASLLQRVLAKPGGVPTYEARRAWILLFESLVCVDLADRTIPIDLPENRSMVPRDTGRATPPYSPHSTTQATLQVGAHLRPSSGVGAGGRRRMGRRALKILQSRWSVIDLRAALEVAEQYGHEACLEYLYEHLRMYKELGMALRMADNGASLLRACRRHGEREPRLWVEAIKLFVPRAVQEDYGGTREDGRIHDEGENYEDERRAAHHRKVGKTEADRELSMDQAERENEEGVLGGRGQVEEGVENSDQDDDEDASKHSDAADTSIPLGSGISVGTAQDVVDEAMMALDRSGALCSVEIVDAVVAACPHGAWGVVREYFERVCTGLRKEASAAEHEAVLLATELGELRREAQRLGKEPVVIKPGKCATCGDSITVPAVHFYCGHSFHAACLAPGGTAIGSAGNSGGGGGGVSMVMGGAVGDERTSAVATAAAAAAAAAPGDERQGVWAEECPKCTPELDAMLSMRQAVEERNSRHDEFFAALKSARDGFTTIVEALERSPFL